MQSAKLCIVPFSSALACNNTVKYRPKPGKQKATQSISQEKNFKVQESGIRTGPHEVALHTKSSEDILIRKKYTYRFPVWIFLGKV